MNTRTTLIAGLLAGALGAGASTGAAAARTAHTDGSAPVIHEHFTALPCKGSPRHRTTLELEGCAEHAVLRADRTIDGLNRTIDMKLSRSGRREFAVATDDWVTYRGAQCRVASSPYAGGSEQPVVDAECLAAQDAAHITDLRTLLQDSFPSAGTR